MSLCILEPFTQSLPINCNLVAYRLGNTVYDAPVVTIRRGGVEMSVPTTTVTETPGHMDVPVSRVCGDETVTDIKPTPYTVVELSLTDVQVGDELLVDGYGGGMIEAATTVACPLPYAPECNGSTAIECPAGETQPDVDAEDDSVGCNAGPGASGFLVALAVLGFMVVRPRRSRA